jgi:hypothetical protein
MTANPTMKPRVRRATPRDLRPFRCGFLREFCMQVRQHLIGDVKKRAANEQPYSGCHDATGCYRWDKERPA